MIVLINIFILIYIIFISLFEKNLYYFNLNFISKVNGMPDVL